MADLKIEAGKYYKTRGGQKAFVALRNPVKGVEEEIWLGFVFEFGRPVLRTWDTEDGLDNVNDTSRFDLIAEWVDPIIVWINVYPVESGCNWRSREEADKYASCNRTGCIKINLAELQGRYDD